MKVAASTSPSSTATAKKPDSLESLGEQSIEKDGPLRLTVLEDTPVLPVQIILQTFFSLEDIDLQPQ